MSNLSSNGEQRWARLENRRRRPLMNTLKVRVFWTFSLLLVLQCPSPAQPVRTFRQQREAMVQRYIAPAGVTNRRVLRAMSTVPRHEFVPSAVRQKAYLDMALPIGSGQTISSPYIVAFMTSQLDPQPDDRILEIGTGSGYQAAVLSVLIKDVYTIEIVPELGNRAKRTLQRLRRKNVHVRIGDGYQGWPEHAPFDKIIVTCSPENIPQPLIDQLSEGGHLVIPVGERYQQTLYRFTKVDGKLERQRLEATFFVPMTGQAEDERKIKPDPAHPTIVNGSFEQQISETREPLGWYYVRQGQVEQDASAPDKSHCVTFINKGGSEFAHALQSFGIDGRKVARIQVSLWSLGKRIQPDLRAIQRAQLVIEFYGEDRSRVALSEIPVRTGSFNWSQQRTTIDVPETARLAVLGIGLFGVVGELSIDNVIIKTAAR